MSDWKVGDLAVCVDSGALSCPHVPRLTHTGLRTAKDAAPRIVFGIRATGPSTRGVFCGCTSLTFADGSQGVSQRFRRVRPDAHEKCEEEFTKLVRRGRVDA